MKDFFCEIFWVLFSIRLSSKTSGALDSCFIGLSFDDLALLVVWKAVFLSFPFPIIFIRMG